MTNAGKRIYLDAEVRVTYYPRSDLISLARQYFNFGCGRARTLLKHRTRPRLRQLLPVVVFLICLSSLALAVLDAIYLSVAGAYVVGCVAWGAVPASREKEPCLLLSGVAAVTMHMSWAAGFIISVLHPTAWLRQTAWWATLRGDER
jgi:succinoglycan biosynthesis protein ExoA